MLRKVVQAVAASGGWQLDIELPVAVLSPLECTFGFDPSVVVSPAGRPRGRVTSTVRTAHPCSGQKDQTSYNLVHATGEQNI